VNASVEEWATPAYHMPGVSDEHPSLHYRGARVELPLPSSIQRQVGAFGCSLGILIISYIFNISLRLYVDGASRSEF
jgi:hypothetical protein